MCRVFLLSVSWSRFTAWVTYIQLSVQKQQTVRNIFVWEVTYVKSFFKCLYIHIKCSKWPILLLEKLKLRYNKKVQLVSQLATKQVEWKAILYFFQLTFHDQTCSVTNPVFTGCEKLLEKVAFYDFFYWKPNSLKSCSQQIEAICYSDLLKEGCFALSFSPCKVPLLDRNRKFLDYSC